MGKASEQDTLVLRERKLMQALAYYEGERIQAELSNHEQESQRFKKEASRIGYELSLLRPELYRRFPLLNPSDRRNVDENLETLPPGVEVWEYFRSEEHTSELQSLMRISYAVFCLKKKKKK